MVFLLILAISTQMSFAFMDKAKFQSAYDGEEKEALIIPQLSKTGNFQFLRNNQLSPHY